MSALTYMNLKLPAQQIVAQLVYELYGVSIPFNAVWSPPIAYAPILEDTYQRDTAVTLTMPQGAIVVTGTAVIRYSRLSLGDLEPENSNGIFTEALPVTVEELLPQINYYYGTELTLDDVLNTTYTADSGAFVLTANPGSFAWKGFIDLELEIGESTAEYESSHEHESTHESTDEHSSS